MRKKLCIIFMLIVLLLNSSLSIVIAEAVDAIKENINKDKTKVVAEFNLTKYENFDTTTKDSDTGSKGVLAQFNFKTGVKFAEGEEYQPIKKTSINVDLPWIGEYKPERVEVITKSTKATNGGKTAKYEYHSSTGILEIIAENEDYAEKVADARDEYEIICIYKSDCYVAEDEARNLRIRANVEETFKDKDETKLVTNVDQNFDVKEKVSGVVSVEHQTDDIYDGYIKANERNPENKYETTFKETAKIMVSNKDIAQKIEVKETSKDVVYTDSTIDKAQVQEILGENGSIDVLDAEGKILITINKDTEADENGKIKVTYTNRPETFFLRLNNVEKEGIIEVENSRIILPTAIIENSAIITDVSVNGINTIKTKNIDTEKKENSAEEIEEDLIKYEYNDKITIEIKQAISTIETKLSNDSWVNNTTNDVVITETLKTDGPQNSLFKNPIINIEMPAEVSKIEIQSTDILYDNEIFKIASESIKTSERGNKMVSIQMEGCQTVYNESKTIGGTSVRISLKIKLQKNIDNRIGSVRNQYSNEITNTVETKDIDVTLNNKIVDVIPTIYSTQRNSTGTVKYDQDNKKVVFNQNGVVTEIAETLGDIPVDDNGTIYEKEFVKQNVKVTNTTNDTKKVAVTINLPEGMTYIEKIDDDGEIYHEEKDYYDLSVKYDYIENKEKQITLDFELQSGESNEKFIEVKADSLESNETEKIVEIGYTSKVDGVMSEVFSIKNVIKKAELYVRVKPAIGNNRREWMFVGIIYNLSNEDLNNINYTFEASDFFEINNVRCGEETLVNKEIGNSWTYKIDKIEANQTISFAIVGNVTDFDESQGYEYEIKGISTVYGEGINTYISNEARKTGWVEAIEIEMSADKSELKMDEEITYTVNLRNVGKTWGYFATYTNFDIKDVIPEEMVPIDVTYNNYKVKIETIEAVGGGERQVTRLEEYNNTKDISNLIIPDGADKDEAPNVDIPIILPRDKTVTLKIRAKAKMLTETKEVTNTVSAEGYWIKKKQASVNTKIYKYDYDEQEPNPTPEPQPINVTGVKLNVNTLKLKINEKAQLNAIIEPQNADNKNLTWSSNNSGIASVNNSGMVTGLAEGTSTITVTTEDGGKTARCEVIVTENSQVKPTPDPKPNPDPIPDPEPGDDIRVTGIKLDTNSIKLDVGEKKKLTVIIEPDNAKNKNITWSTMDSDIAIVDNDGNVTGIAKGTTTIMVTTEDGGKVDTCEVTVNDTQVINPDNPKTDDSDNSSNTEKNKISISGIAWIDENEDGKRMTDEKAYSDMTVMLYDYKKDKFVRENNEILKTKTNAQGEYRFENIEKGQYIVLFLYDTENYSLTIYQKEGVIETKNSDAVTKNIAINGEKMTAGLTNILTANGDLENIDIGLVENKTFDLELQKYISQITVQTKDGKTKTYDYDNKQFAKIEINSKKLSGATVIIKYKIVVTNKGEITGKAAQIIDKLPEGMQFKSELNNSWYENNGNLYTNSLSKEEINVGESKEIELVLTKNLSGSSAGTVLNVATIGISSNDKAVEDENVTNNTSQAQVIIAVETGLVRKIGLTISILIVLIGLAILIWKNRKILKSAIFVVLVVICIVGNTKEVLGYDWVTGLTIRGKDTDVVYPSDSEVEHNADGNGLTAVGSDGKEYICNDHAYAFCDSYWHKAEKKSGERVEKSEIYEEWIIKTPIKLSNETKKEDAKIEYYDNSYNTIGPIKVTSNYTDATASITIVYKDDAGKEQEYQYNDSEFKWNTEVKLKIPKSIKRIVKIKVDATYEKGKAYRKYKYKYIWLYKTYTGKDKNDGDYEGTDKCDKKSVPMQGMKHEDWIEDEEEKETPIYANIEINLPCELQGDLEINKTDFDSKNYLNEVKFVLQKDASTYLQLKDTKGNIVSDIEIEQDMIFSSSTNLKVNNKQYTANFITSKSNATKLIMKKDGKILIRNIRYGKYRFYEVDNKNYAFTKMVNSNVMEILASKKVTETLTNEKQVGSLKIYKEDADNEDKKLKNTTFVLKTTSGYVKVKATGDSVINDSTTGYATKIVGSATINDTTDNVTDKVMTFNAIKTTATQFVTDANGIVEIKNLLTSANGKDALKYTIEEISSENYGYTKIVDAQNVIIERTKTKEVTITNEKQVGNLKIYKKDFDDSNKNIKNATFVLKSSYGKGYLKVKATGNSVTNEKSTGYATKIVGSATINDSTNNTNDKVAVFTETKVNATKFVTDVNGIIEIKNLLTSSNGKDAITYTIEEISNTNYAYTKLADFKDVTIERTKTKEITIKNMKQTGDLEISKIDYDNQRILLKNVEFAIKSSYGKGYIKIRATGDSITNDKDGYATKVIGSAKINDTTEDDITPSIKYVANANNATKFVTDSSGKISIKNLISTINGTANITYTIEELSNDNYGYTKKVNNLTTTVERLDVRKVIFRNEKQVGNIGIKKVDDRVESKKLTGVEFVLKSSYKKDTYIKVKGICTNSTKDKNGYLTSATGNVVINDTAENSKTPSIEYVTKMEDATKFVTDANGQLAIQNLLMSTNGTDKITYKFIETKNPNYGYLAYENGVVEMNHGVTFIGDSKSTINKDGEFTIPRKGTMNYTIKNHQDYIRIEGYVWEEITNSENNAINNLYDDGRDSLVKGLNVYLYKDNKLIAKRQTNKDGWYEFGTRKQNGKAYTNKDFLTEENGNLKIDDLSKYRIEIEYDGLRFKTVSAIIDYMNDNYPNTSKITEVPSGRNDKKDREDVNESFTTVSNNMARNSKNQKSYDLSYTFADHVSTYKDKWGYEYTDNNTKVKVTQAANSEYAIIASTKQSGFKIEEAWEKRFKGLEAIKSVNMGLQRRNQADLAVSSDLTEMNIAVNNGQNVYNNTYTYAKRTSEENTDNFGVEVKFGTGIGSYSSRGLNIYTRRIYESDLALENLKPGSMQIYVTYKIRVINQSTILNAKVKELADYYDERYEIADSWETNDKGYKRTITWGKSRYGSTEGASGYKAAYTSAFTNREILPGGYVDVYIKFKLNNDAVKALIQKQTTLNNVSEINAFSTVMGGKTYAAIDVDSNPGSANIKLQNDGKSTSTKLNGRNYEIENKTLDMTTFEDDTDSAPSLVLGIEDTNPTRGLSGTVFEDSNKKGSKTNTNEERIGDGIFKNGENKVANAKVELLDENGTAIKLYELSVTNGVIKTQTKEAVTHTDANGEYKFLGVIPGRYLIRYTYDENTTINGKKIDVRDYKSTIISSDIIKNALRIGNTDERRGNYNWILSYDQLPQNGKEDTKSKSKDLAGLIRYSSAVDDLSMRAQQEQNGINYGSIESGDNSMVADSAYFDVGVEYSNVTENDGFNQRVSFTDYTDEYKIENGKIVVIKNGKIVVADTFYAVNPCQDFGIIERPRQSYTINKRISNVKVVLSNGQVLISGNPYIQIADKDLYQMWNEIEKTATGENAMKYVKALPSRVVLEIDNELIQGATLELEYTISVKNDSELDYEYSVDSDYYYYGTQLPGQELKTVVSKVVDYMDDNLVYTDNLNSSIGWNKVSANQLSAWEENGITKKLIADNVSKDIKSGYTIAITDQFSKLDLTPGKVGSVTICGSKLLASNEKGIKTDNHVEILETTRKNEKSIPGNYDPKTGKENEKDNDMTSITITPPTGLLNNKVFIVSVSSIILVALASGIYFIKKRILE